MEIQEKIESINRNCLLSQLLPLIMKKFSVDKGSLILLDDEQLMIVCECNIEDKTCQNYSCDLKLIPLASNNEIPINLVNHVWHNQETLISDQNMLEKWQKKDTYFQQKEWLSFLCKPINSSTKKLGIIYLEKNSDNLNFVKENIEMLDFLISQTAMALDNKMLCQKIADYARFLEQEVKQKTEELYYESCKCEKTQNKLAEVLELNRQIITNVQEGIIVIDTNFCYRLWNPFMENLTGISSQEIIGKSCLNLLPFVEEKGIFDLIKRSLNGEFLTSPDIKFYLQNTGKIAWTSEQFSPLRDAEGNIIGVIITVHDVTERKQTEEALKKSQIRLKLINNLLQSISLDLSWEDIITLIITDLSEYFNGFRVAYLTINQQNKANIIHSQQPASMTSLKGWELDFSLTLDYLQALKNNQYLAYEDITKEQRLTPIASLMSNENIKAILDLPIKNAGDLIGLICFDSPLKHNWNQDEINTLNEIANYLVFAHQNILIKNKQKLGKWSLQKLNQKLIYKNKALREVEEKFTQLVENINQVFFIQECNPFKLIYVSDTVEKVWGLSPDVFFRNHWAWLDCIHPEDYNNVVNDFQQYVNGINFDRQYRIIKPNGEIRWVWVRTFLIKNNQGEVYRIAGIGEDVTEKRQIEDALRLSEARYRTLVETIPYGIEEVDLDGKIIFNNLTHFQMFGYSTQEVTHKYIWDLNVKEVRSHLKNFFQTIKTQYPAPIPFMGKGLAKNGKVFDIQVDWNYRRNEEGEIIGFISIITDITEKNKAQEALKKSEELYRCIVETAEEGIWIIDAENKITFANPKIANMLGYTVEEMMGKSFFNFINKEDIKIISKNRTTRQRGITEKYDCKFSHRNGSDIWTFVSATPMYNNTDTYTGTLKMIADITERKQIEEELIKAKEEAEAANQAKSSFLANMSHELRTPLNGILGYAQILQLDEQILPIQKHQINIIHSCGNHLLTLINDILDLAKIEAGKTELNLCYFDFIKFLLEIAEIANIEAKQKGISFSYQPLNDLPNIIYSDEKRLRQVLLNLLQNALKFTQKGRVIFRVENLMSDLVTNQTKIKFEIEDTGIGIHENEIEKIFQPFEQVHNSDCYNEGTGLGLAISQEIVQKMGSILKVKSRLNHGSIFSFDLAVLSKLNSLDFPLIKSNKVISYQGNQKTILVVDDSKVNRNLLVQILTLIGFKVVEAENGEEGFNKALEEQPDLIIIDLLMPVIDGFEMAKQIKVLPRFQNTILLACSASVSDIYIEKSKAVGFHHFIPKPLNYEELLRKIQDYLGLSWNYQEFNLSAQHNLYVEEEKNNIIEPPLMELRKLYDLAKKGLIDNLIKEVEIVKNNYLFSQTFCQNLLNLAYKFKLKELRNLLKKSIDKYDEN